MPAPGFLPWAVALMLREGKNFGIGWIPRPALADLPLTLANLLLALDQPDRRLTWLGALLAVALAGWGLFRWRSARSGPALFLTSWLLTPLLFTWLLSLRLPVYVDRQLIISLPALLLAASAAVASLRPARVVLFLLTAWAAFQLWGSPHLQKEDWRAAAAAITRAEQPGDGLVMHSLQSQFPFDYYYRGALPRAVATINQQTIPLAELAAGHRRVWLVFRRPSGAIHTLAQTGPFSWRDVQNPILKAWLEAHQSQLALEQSWPGVYVVRYDF